jgi:hypothetical protein
MLHSLAIQLVARFVVLWMLARAMLASLGLWFPTTRTAVLLSLLVAAVFLLDILRRRERLLLANLGLSLPVLYGIAALISLALELGTAVAFGMASVGTS